MTIRSDARRDGRSSYGSMTYTREKDDRLVDKISSRILVNSYKTTVHEECNDTHRLELDYSRMVASLDRTPDATAVGCGSENLEQSTHLTAAADTKFGHFKRLLKAFPFGETTAH